MRTAKQEDLAGRSLHGRHCAVDGAEPVRRITGEIDHVAIHLSLYYLLLEGAVVTACKAIAVLDLGKLLRLFLEGLFWLLQRRVFAIYLLAPN